jgi:hypothetical protein
MTAFSCELRGVSVGSRRTTEGRTGPENVNENYLERSASGFDEDVALLQITTDSR